MFQGSEQIPLATLAIGSAWDWQVHRTSGPYPTQQPPQRGGRERFCIRARSFIIEFALRSGNHGGTPIPNACIIASNSRAVSPLLPPGKIYGADAVSLLWSDNRRLQLHDCTPITQNLWRGWRYIRPLPSDG